MASLSRTIVRNLDIDMLYDKKARSSFCWKYFGSIVRIEDGKRKILNPEQVYCSVCLKNVQEESDEVFFGSVKIRCYSRRVSTGNLIRHLRDDHEIREESYYYKSPQIMKIKIEETPTETCTASSSESSTSVVNDKWQLANDLALWFSKSLLPFDSVSDEGMVDFFKKYNIILSENDLPSRNSVGNSALFNVYECILTNVKEVIRLHVPRHCSITFELWTDRYRKLNYITFILQYLTTDFELKSLTLSTEILREKATRETISNVIKDLKKRFEFEGKNIHAVINESSNFKRASTFENMDHHLCLGHGLHHLVIVDGIRSVSEIHELVKKCKKIVQALCYRMAELEFDCEELQKGLICAIEKVAETLEMDERDEMRYENDSVGANEDEEIVTSEDLTSKDVTPTRWHIVLEMLDFFINMCNRERLNDMLKRIDQEILTIKQNEWSVMEDLIELLSKLRGVVEILSYQKTCTINVGLVFRAELKDVLKVHGDNESLIISSLKYNMLENIDRRFPVTKLLIAAALLDKRFMRLKEVDSYLESRNLTKVTFLTSYIKELIQSDDLHPDTMKIKNESLSGPTTDTTSILSMLSRKHSVSDGTEDPIEQECWRYFALGSPDLQGDDLLPFWKENKCNFPWLSSFARALLCIPATSTPSDRIFSIEGLNFTAKRSRLDPFRMNKIIFIHDNYKVNKVTADE